MNQERTNAYSRVVRTLDDLGPTKLHADEQERVREAADTLIFAPADDAASVKALAGIAALAEHLVATGRWSEERAEVLVDDVRGCGPAPLATTAA